MIYVSYVSESLPGRVYGTIPFNFGPNFTFNPNQFMKALEDTINGLIFDGLIQVDFTPTGEQLIAEAPLERELSGREHLDFSDEDKSKWA